MGLGKLGFVQLDRVIDPYAVLGALGPGRPELDSVAARVGAEVGSLLALCHPSGDEADLGIERQGADRALEGAVLVAGEAADGRHGCLSCSLL